MELAGAMRPDLARILLIHIPKCGGSDFLIHLHESGQVVVVPTHEELLRDLFILNELPPPEHARQPGSFRSGISQLLDQAEAKRRVSHMAPFNHLDLLTALSHHRPGLDQMVCLLRPPLETTASMLRFRIGQSLQNPTSRASLDLFRDLSTSPEDILKRAQANDQKLYRDILLRERHHLDLAAWLLLPFQSREKAGYQALSNIYKSKIVCAPIEKMGQLLGHVLGTAPTRGELPRKNASFPLLVRHSDINIQISDEVLREATSRTSLEIHQAIKESGALECWSDQGLDQATYWQNIKAALSRHDHLINDGDNRPLAAEVRTALVDQHQSLQHLRSRIQALESSLQTSQAYSQALETHNQSLHSAMQAMHASTSWRLTAPLRQMLDVLRAPRRSKAT